MKSNIKLINAIIFTLLFGAIPYMVNFNKVSLIIFSILFSLLLTYYVFIYGERK
jgi:hypothetical protein